MAYRGGIAGDLTRCQYVRLPAPATEPYILRLTIDAGSAATKHGVLHTNFPLDDSDFERSKFHQRECVRRARGCD